MQIDVMAVDYQNRLVFAGECKYHVKPVDATVYFDLKDKIAKAGEIQNAFRGYDMIYGIFSKSGFSKRLADIAAEGDRLLLIHKDRLYVCMYEWQGL